MTKINEILPKILDIKSEVLNTADTVRQMGIDVKTLNDNFNKAVGGLQAATQDVIVNNTDLQMLDDVKSFRLSINNDINHKKSTGNQNDIILATPNVPVKGAAFHSTPNVIDLIGQGRGESSTSGVTKRPLVFHGSISSDDSVDPINQEVNHHDDPNKRPWNTVVSSGQKRKDRRKEQQQRQQRQQQKPRHPPPHQRKPNAVRLTGTRKETDTLKAVKRTGDVYVGRVDTSVSVEEMTNYIKNNFEVNLIKVEQLKIKTDRYVAFKITVNLMEREKLFNSELWPEYLIVDKFYSYRSSRPQIVGNI